MQGEHHELAARMVSDFVEMAGFDVVFLGADVPPEDVVSMTEESDALLVALSMTVSLHWTALRATVNALREAKGADFLILAGGRATVEHADELRELGVTDVGEDAAKMVEEALASLRRKAS